VTLRHRPPAGVEVPEGILATLPEWMVWRELTETHRMREGLDFFFESSLIRGGRGFLGGLEADFFFPALRLAFEIQGVWHHYRNAPQLVREVQTLAEFTTRGYTLIFLDEDALYLDVRFYVSEALQFRDHSRMSRGMR
jgi:hypothetical protein